MSRRWHVDGMHDKPRGMRVAGFDPETQIFTYEAADGSIWISEPGVRGEPLTQVTGPRPAPPPTPTTPSTQQGTGHTSTTSQTQQPQSPPVTPQANTQGQTTPQSSGGTFQRLAGSVTLIGRAVSDAQQRARERSRMKKEEKRAKEAAKREKDIDDFLRGGRRSPSPPTT
ncbi:hypothetical protein F5Y06DRAFT_300188 [Hypoxylon sp. FL0890]|nr:hypothetical protein F5Y06DRAFT_300188 [Hypoxylon sp. FL0890]